MPDGTNKVRTADFMGDALHHVARFRTFKIINDLNRETLVTEIGPFLRAERVIPVIDLLKESGELPHRIWVVNGPEFLAQRLKPRQGQSRADLSHSTRPPPTQNAFIERFNRTYRNKILNLDLFRSLEDVREITARRMGVHNEYRPP